MDAGFAAFITSRYGAILNATTMKTVRKIISMALNIGDNLKRL